MINPCRFNWTILFGQVDIVFDNKNYTLMTGYVTTAPGLYIRVFEGDEFICGEWLDETAYQHCINYCELPEQLKKEFEKLSLRMEKLKAFI